MARQPGSEDAPAVIDVLPIAAAEKNFRATAAMLDSGGGFVQDEDIGQIDARPFAAP